MAISASSVSSSPISASAEAGAILIIVTSTISVTVVTEEEILTRTERHILTFAAELMPWVLTR